MSDLDTMNEDDVVKLKRERDEAVADNAAMLSLLREVHNEPVCLPGTRPGQRLLDELADTKSELERLRTFVAALKHTDDGKPMVPGGHYWAECRDRWADGDEPYELLEVIWWQGSGDDCFNPEYVLAGGTDMGWEFFDVRGVYSTQEAALAAQEARP